MHIRRPCQRYLYNNHWGKAILGKIRTGVYPHEIAFTKELFLTVYLNLYYDAYGPKGRFVILLS